MSVLNHVEQRRAIRDLIKLELESLVPDSRRISRLIIEHAQLQKVEGPAIPYFKNKNSIKSGSSGGKISIEDIQ